MMGKARVATRHTMSPSALEDLYKQFKSWNEEYSTNALRSLSQPSGNRAPPPVLPPQRVVRGDKPKAHEGETFTIRDVENQTETRADVQIVDVNPSFRPHASYEVCTPSDRSFIVGDDPKPMLFRPFSDDPTFNHQGYDDEYEVYAWDYLPDPDLELLSAEIMSRFDLLPSDIDVIGLPKGVKTRRDHTELPAGWKHPAAGDASHSGAGPREQLQRLALYFCNNPNCLTGYCTVHEEMPLLHPVAPSVSDDTLANSTPEACGENCFLLKLSTRPVPDPWTDNDVEMLEVVLEQSPDALPCDLAVICRKPCYEVSKRRREYFAIHKPEKSRRRPHPPRFNDLESSQFTPYDLVISLSDRPDGPAGICHVATKAPVTPRPTASAGKTMRTVRSVVVAIRNAYASGKVAVALGGKGRGRAARAARATIPIWNVIRDYVCAAVQSRLCVFVYFRFSVANLGIIEVGAWSKDGKKQVNPPY
ncbi:hypothetical protein CC2G_004271 [Coprinopsis cinerea AmutBmut pab1-1]|nr:hypothetical protein CC2G_004271 [Coprinopsis cinerea AmutBmut pab1-1]